MISTTTAPSWRGSIADGKRRFHLLCCEERSENGGNRSGHAQHQLPRRACWQEHRAAPDQLHAAVQAHQVPGSRQGLHQVHDGSRSDECLAQGFQCLLLPAAEAYASNPIWTENPIHAPYAKASETLRPNGYAGPLGYASAAVDGGHSFWSICLPPRLPVQPHRKRPWRRRKSGPIATTASNKSRAGGCCCTPPHFLALWSEPLLRCHPRRSECAAAFARQPPRQ